MNKFERSKMGMNWAVRQVLLDNSAFTALVPGFPALVTTHGNHIALGESALKVEEFNSSGPKMTKKANKNALIAFMIEYKSKLLAYAATSKNNDLLTECNINDSDIQKMEDARMKSVSMGFYDRMQLNLVALAVYGINATTQAAYLAAINAFVNFISKASTSNTGEVVSRSDFKYYLGLMDEDLKQIDIQMGVLRNSQPAFYKKYKYVRICEKPKVSTLSLRIKTINADTGLYIPMVTVELTLIEENPNGTLAAENSFVSNTIIKKTKDKGLAYFRSLEAGMYKVVAYKNGVQTYNGTIAINDGERTDLQIELKKLPSVEN